MAHKNKEEYQRIFCGLLKLNYEMIQQIMNKSVKQYRMFDFRYMQRVSRLMKAKWNKWEDA